MSRVCLDANSGSPMTSIASKLAAGLDELAFLLDVDGTLLDLAPTPREVRVPPELRETLFRLWQRSGGAVAFVSGRSDR